MQPRYCRKGSQLRDLYTQKTLLWGIAESRKREGVSTASRAEWFEIARTAEHAKVAHDKAKCDFIDHMMDCPVCETDVVLSAPLDRKVAYC
jgi:hypothetical protein